MSWYHHCKFCGWIGHRKEDCARLTARRLIRRVERVKVLANRLWEDGITSHAEDAAIFDWANAVQKRLSPSAPGNGRRA